MALPTTATSPTREQFLEQDAEKRQQQLSTIPLDDFEKDSTQVSTQQPTDEAPSEEEPRWVTGIQLLTIIAAICLVCFLMLLDTSIIVTVKATV